MVKESLYPPMIKLLKNRKERIVAVLMNSGKMERRDVHALV